MAKVRVGLAILVATTLAVGTAAVATRSDDDPAAADATTTTGKSSTTEAPASSTNATRPSTTTTPPPTTTTTALPADLQGGAAGPHVEALQRRLGELHFDPGSDDGRFGPATVMAVWAFQKLHGLPPDGRVTPDLWRRLQSAGDPPPLAAGAGPERVEIDLGRQLLFVYDAGKLRLITHVSTGTGQRYCDNGTCGVAVTPAGSYRFTWRYKGWRTSALGELYNPVYFKGGIAVHGAKSVPPHPASHGCVRIPMHIAEYFPTLVARGDPVEVIAPPVAA